LFIDLFAHGDQWHRAGDLIAHGGQRAQVLARGQAADQQFGIDLRQRIGNILRRGYPGAMRRDAGSAQQAVERLDGIARGTVYDQRNRGRVAQGCLPGRRRV